MTQQFRPGAVRRLTTLASQRARGARRAVRQAYQDAGWSGAARQSATLIGELAMRPVHHWRERRLDQRLRMDTRTQSNGAGAGRASEAIGVYGDSVEYSPTPIHHFENLLRQLRISTPSDFAFIDVGCGKGRTLILAAQHGFKPVIGVELDTELSDIARVNARAFATASPSHGQAITVVNSDAAVYRFPPAPAVVFLFNPFGADTLRAVIANLERSLHQHPRQLVVAYFNAVHCDVLTASPALRQTAGNRQWAVYESAHSRPRS